MVKVMVMNYDKGSWYKGMVGKIFKIESTLKDAYKTEKGSIKKEHAEVIGKWK